MDNTRVKNIGRRLLWLPLVARRRLMRHREKPYQAMLDRLADAAVGDVTIRVPDYQGDFKMSPRGHVFRRIVRSGAYEPDVAQAFRAHLAPGRDVLDIGANIGLFSVLAAKYTVTSNVYAVEPSSGAHARLISNISANNCLDQITPMKLLISDSTETRELHVVEEMEEYSSLSAISSELSGGRVAREFVESKTLDSLVYERGITPAIIKIDTEGAEYSILRGGMRVLSELKPTIIMEVAPTLLRNMGASGAQILQLLRQYGYSIYDMRGRKVHGEFSGNIVASAR